MGMVRNSQIENDLEDGSGSDVHSEEEKDGFDQLVDRLTATGGMRYQSEVDKSWANKNNQQNEFASEYSKAKKDAKSRV